jgi:hypothetical protein
MSLSSQFGRRRAKLAGRTKKKGLLRGRPLVGCSICGVVEAILSSNVGDVGASFVRNNHAADWDTSLHKSFHACVIKELLKSPSWRILDVVLQVQEACAFSFLGCGIAGARSMCLQVLQACRTWVWVVEWRRYLPV